MRRALVLVPVVGAAAALAGAWLPLPGLAAALLGAVLGATAALVLSTVIQRRLDDVRDELSRVGATLRQRYQDLTQERVRQERLLDSLPTALLLFGRDGLAYANPVARELFGIGLDQSGSRLQILGSEALADAVAEVLETHRSLDVEVNRGERHLTAHVVPTGEDLVALIVTDVTDARRLEAIRRDFVTNASHELKTPAAGMQALADSLGLAIERDPERARGMISRLQDEAARLATLVRDLLDLARVEEEAAPDAELQRVDLAEIARSQVDRIQPLAVKRGVKVRVDAAEPASLVALPGDLRLIVGNLVENAVRYNRPGGHVDVRVRRTSGEVVLEVEDNGIGIPEADRDRVFERFYRVDKARSRAAGGTGLGLAIVRHATERHGGDLTMSSVLGEGSTFRIALPVGGSPATSSTATPGPGWARRQSATMVPAMRRATRGHAGGAGAPDRADATEDQPPAPKGAAAPHAADGLPQWVRLLLVLGFLYVFLVGVGLLEGGIRAFGEGFEARLLSSVDNPLAGLLAGIAATVIVQSSSISTATIVGLVGAGTLPVELAVPMVMGANIGTTVTNTLASLGSIRRPDEFRRAFAAATMHDFFNIIAVAILFPIELVTGVLSRSALWLGGALGRSGVSGAEAESPIRTGVKAGVGLLEGGVDALVGSGVVLGVALILLGITLLFVSLRLVTTNMRKVLAGRLEQAMNRMLNRGGGLAGIAIGIIITVLVMSSSITTSILVPMVAAGVLTTRNAYPITLGANIGTTATALIASLAVVRPEGLVIALVHMLFNMVAIAIVYPVRRLRYLPVRLAEMLADRAVEHRTLVAAYVAGLFVIVPFAGVILLA